MSAVLSMSDASVVADGPSAGTLLRRAREAQGLHVAALAVSLKVPVRKIEALEQDRLDELPDAVFARALASSMCRTLKIDPRPILDRLPQVGTPRLVNERSNINAPFRAPGDVAPATWKNRLTRPVSLVVIALLVGAIVLVFVPNMRRDEPLVVKHEDAPGVPMAAMVTQAPSASADAPVAAASAPVDQVVAPPAAQAAVAAPAATSMQPASAAVAPAPAQAVQVPADGAVPATGTVVFRTKGPSWVEVTDAQGVVTLRRLMGPGETAGASGAQPLAITVGSVRDTTVEVRGKPYDLAPVSKDNVARFEVK
jgi:cytoskeleton protein RodZ